jgi:photosystem II stability/assembly factor-like uncharacterized protein
MGNSRKNKNDRTRTLIAAALTVSLLAGSCSHDDSASKPEKKKYAWVAGQADSTGYGTILFSADGGETWVRQGGGTTALHGIDVNDIWATDETHVWAAASNNTVLKTTDGGATWNTVQMPSNPGNPSLFSISIAGKTDIWVSGTNGTVYHSGDNGSSWTMFDTTIFRSGVMQGICAISTNTVYVAGGIPAAAGKDRGFIGYTLNGGATWDTISLADNYNQHQWIGVAASGTTIVVYGVKAHYAVSTDGGITWINDTVPGTGGFNGADINHLIARDPRRWWGAFDHGQVFLTTDGGGGWTKQQTAQSGYFLIGIDAWDNQTALAVGIPQNPPFTSPIIGTTNGGSSWERKTMWNSFLEKVTFIKD